MSLEYVCRVLPIDKWSEVLAPREGRVIERFDRFCFASEQAHPERVPVNLRHDHERQVGTLVSLEPKDGWWQARWRPDPARAEYLKTLLRVGTGVSAEFSPVGLQRVWNVSDKPYTEYWRARLNALAVDVRPVYEGAEVIDIIERPARAAVRAHAGPAGGVLFRPNLGYVVAVNGLPVAR